MTTISAKDRFLAWARSGTGAAVLLTAAAFLLRAWYAWYAAGVPPWNDMEEWDRARLSILHGQPYTAYWTPLYPALLAGVSRLAGGGYFALYVFNSALTALACLFTYLAAEEVFGRRTALLALALAAFYADSVWYSSLLLAENLGVLLLALLTWRCARDGSPWLNGLLFGLTCLTKGLFLALLPGFIAWTWLRRRPGPWLREAAVFSGVALLTLLPWGVRNTLVYKAPVLLEPHWASAVFVGHNPYATGGCDYDYLAHDYGKFELDPSLTIIEKNRIYLRRSLDFMLHNPLKELKLTVLRASKHLTFATSFVYYRAPYPLRKFMAAAATLQNLLLFPLCALGFAFAFRDRGGFGFAMIVAILAGAFITVFSANTRMRMTMVPAMLTLAARGALLLPGLAARVRAGDTAGIRGPLAGAALAALLLFANFAYQLATRLGDAAGRFN